MLWEADIGRALAAMEATTRSKIKSIHRDQ
jgi:hypothetical protein